MATNMRRRKEKVTFQRSSETTLVSKMLNVGTQEQTIVTEIEQTLIQESSKLSANDRVAAKDNPNVVSRLKAAVAEPTDKLRERVKAKVIPSMHRKLDGLVDGYVDHLVMETLDKLPVPVVENGPEEVHIVVSGEATSPTTDVERAVVKTVIAKEREQKVKPSSHSSSVNGYSQRNDHIPAKNGPASDKPEHQKVQRTKVFQQASEVVQEKNPDPSYSNQTPDVIAVANNKSAIDNRSNILVKITESDHDSENVQISIRSRMKVFQELAKGQTEGGPTRRNPPQRRPISMVSQFPSESSAQPKSTARPISEISTANDPEIQKAKDPDGFVTEVKNTAERSNENQLVSEDLVQGPVLTKSRSSSHSSSSSGAPAKFTVSWEANKKSSVGHLKVKGLHEGISVNEKSPVVKQKSSAKKLDEKEVKANTANRQSNVEKVDEEQKEMRSVEQRAKTPDPKTDQIKMDDGISSKEPHGAGREVVVMRKSSMNQKSPTPKRLTRVWPPAEFAPSPVKEPAKPRPKSEIIVSSRTVSKQSSVDETNRDPEETVKTPDQSLVSIRTTIPQTPSSPTQMPREVSVPVITGSADPLPRPSATSEVQTEEVQPAIEPSVLRQKSQDEASEVVRRSFFMWPPPKEDAGEPLPQAQGSPWRVEVLSAANVTASGNGLQLVPVNTPTKFEVRTGNINYAGGVQVNIASPSGRQVPSSVTNVGNGNFSVEYLPNEVGNYQITVSYEGMAIPGSPFTSKAYNASSIVVSSIPNGLIGKPVEFTIDVTQAGEGQLEIMVNRGSVPNSVRMMSKGVFLVSFVPRDIRPHTVDIKFNGQLLPYSPINVPIMDSSRVTVQGEGLRQVAVNRQSFFRVNTQSAGDADLAVRVTSPNGELVPAKIVQQPDGDYKVEYSSRFTGRHTVEILYAGQAIMGSPFYVEIYDPNKIRVEGTRSGIVSQKMEFDIINNEAGRAELGMTITSPSGRNVPFDISPGPMGEHVSYVPMEPGPHQIFLTYGGLEVPGTPITQTIMDSGSAGAYGEGLKFAHEAQTAEFFVDTQGRKGNLDVQVDGPNSIAKVNIKPMDGGKYKVSYVPVEVGIYSVNIRWNGRPIEGSPYRPRVVNSRMVHPVGGWEAVLDQQERMRIKCNQRNRIDFETKMAGPGEMRAEIKGPDGLVPVDVEGSNGGYSISFIPRTPGDYYIKVFWGEVCLSRCPIYAIAASDAPVVAVPSHDKVVLTGHGLVEARVQDEAEFVIDGTEAGAGEPRVTLSGVKSDIDVRCIPLGGNKYKCVYVPALPGAYLLSIMWSDRQVRGSPFKVNVSASSDASKVSVSGEGIRGGVYGKEIKAVIDTRRAGPGELTAHCMGPQKVAYCELYDHRDGTFTLNIKPQESGKHLLQVKYGGEHVPGSPFVLRVAGAPDASKVRVSGPGLEHGILATYQSRFIVETRGAGAGQLTVRIRGPKGSFRVEMSRESQKDRTILCRYDPTEVGDYVISIKWSGDHVPGSPFHVQIFDTNDEIERFMIQNPARRQNVPAVADRRWSEDL